MNDVVFMASAIDEARKGLGRTHPNPTVGAAIVKRGVVVGRGFHERAGAPHAEAVAISAAGKSVRGSTLYVTLEPCDHHGRTPPCTEAIIAAGIRRVVYASADPNPLVNGRGAQRLRRAGIEVQGGVLANEADALNEPYLKAMREGLSFVTLKAAMTLDGKIANARGESKWITSTVSRESVHRLRDRVDALIVGVQTLIDDDPQLTTRIERGRTPTRVILDSTLRSPLRARVFQEARLFRTIVATTRAAGQVQRQRLEKLGVEVWTLPKDKNGVSLRPLLRRLRKEDLLHALVEGGATLHQSFLTSGLADEVLLYVAPRLFGHFGQTWSGNLKSKSIAKSIALDSLRAQQSGDDLLLKARLR